MSESKDGKPSSAKSSVFETFLLNPIYRIFRFLLGFLAGITNPWIIKTVAICVCVLLIIATFAIGPSLYRSLRNMGETMENATVTTKKVADELAKVASEAIQGGSDLVTGATTAPKQEYASSTDPFISKEQIFSSVSSETRATIANSGGANVAAIPQVSPGSLFGSEPLNLELPDEIIYSLRDPSLKRALLRIGDEIISNRCRAVDEIFDRVESKIPSFVVDHYEDRNTGETFINLMNRQLLTEAELETFIANTALEIDSAIAESVRKHIDAKFLSIDFNTDTRKELQKRLPKAREICESIYQDLERMGINGERKSELLRSYDNLILKYPKLTQVSKTAFVVIIGYLFPPSTPFVMGALAISWLHDVKVIEQRNNYERQLKNQFNDRRNRFKKLVVASVEDLLNTYGEFLAKTTIELRQPFFKP